MHDNWTQCDSFEVVIVVVVMRGRRECDKQTTRPRGGFSCVLLCPRKFSFQFLTPFSRGTRENNHNQPPSVTCVVYSNVHRKGERGGRRRIGILIYFETNRATFDGFFSCAQFSFTTTNNKQISNLFLSQTRYSTFRGTTTRTTETLWVVVGWVVVFESTSRCRSSLVR